MRTKRGNISYLSFYASLISANVAISNFMHFPATDIILFFFMAD